MNHPGSIRPLRAAVLVALPLLLAAALLAVLYGLQVVNAAALQEESRSNITRTETVSASRGNILDRYGRALVTNEVSYDVVISRSALVTDSNPNGILLALISLVEEAGISHRDTLPLSDAAPFAYTGMTPNQRSRLADYIDHFELGSETPEEEYPAEELMAWFRSHYGIPEEYSPEEARLAAGVRWELEMDTLFGGGYVFASGLSQNLIAAISERCYPGVSIATGSRRVYRTPYAAHLLGRTGPMNEEQWEKYSQLGYPMNAMVGQDGAEGAFEEYLHGTDGKRVTVRNAEGEILSSYLEEEPQAGANVTLTLDLSAQQVTEEALAAEIAKINSDRVRNAWAGQNVQLAQGGACVVMQVGTGDILASASYPSYDLSSFQERYGELLADPALPMLNRALQGRYAPGSTFKVVTATAGLSEGVITPLSTIYDRGIIDEYEGYSYTCWAYPGSHGYIDVREALQHSCNYFFYTVGRELGIDGIDRYAEAFGLGQPTGIELYEDRGVLASPEYKRSATGEEWYVGDTFQASIGQSYNLFTPLQLAGYAAAIASGGERYASHILSSVVPRGSERPLLTYAPEVLSTVEADPENLRVIAEGMNMAAKYGTAAYVFGNYPIEVCAKTGTAQIAADSENNAVFIAFAPFEDPEIALAVVVEKGGSGSGLAEVAAEIFDCWFAGRGENEETVQTARSGE